MYSISKLLGSLLFPKQCPGCSRALMKWEKEICQHCMQKLPLITNTKANETILQQRLAGRVNLIQGYAMMRFYQGSLTQKLLHAIKYRGKSQLAISLGEMFGESIKNELTMSDESILVPVPLHPLKHQVRGYNQSEKIAEGLSKSLGIACEARAMERVNFHVSQTKKGKESRWNQIKNDFLAKKEIVRQRDIILVDDVCTSGATIEACAQALKEQEVKTISLLTLAVAGEFYL